VHEVAPVWVPPGSVVEETEHVGEVLMSEASSSPTKPS
jgi:hypothetical protein